MAFNSFAARNKLVEHGMSAEQAEAWLEILAEREAASGANLATKADLAAFATKTDLAELKTDILGKLYAALAAQTVATVGLVVTLIKVIH